MSPKTESELLLDLISARDNAFISQEEVVEGIPYLFQKIGCSLKPFTKYVQKSGAQDQIDLGILAFEFILDIANAEIKKKTNQDLKKETAIYATEEYGCFIYESDQREKVLEITQKVPNEARSKLLQWFITDISSYF